MVSPQAITRMPNIPKEMLTLPGRFKDMCRLWGCGLEGSELLSCNQLAMYQGLPDVGSVVNYTQIRPC